MKTKEFLSELRSSSKEDLIAKRVAVAEELLKSRFKSAVGQTASGTRLSNLRRSLARIETELSSRRK
jgi:large subunit ribosomal protein L29